MKNIIALSVIIAGFTVSCSQDKPKNVAPADYADTEKDLIQNRIQDSTKTADENVNTTTTANGYKIPNDSANTKTK